MTLDPYKKRELVFVLLFSFEMGQDLASDDVVDLVAHECKVAKKYVIEARARVEDILKERDACDARILKICQEYSIARIQSIERNVLRLAIYELMIEKNVPPKVVFSEAKRLAKKFSSYEAATFVHALLAAVSVASGVAVDVEQVDVEAAYQQLQNAATSLPQEILHQDVLPQDQPPQE